jgi:hypothetical protein
MIIFIDSSTESRARSAAGETRVACVSADEGVLRFAAGSSGADWTRTQAPDHVVDSYAERVSVRGSCLGG